MELVLPLNHGIIPNMSTEDPSAVEWYWFNESSEAADTGYRSGVGGGLSSLDEQKIQDELKAFRDRLTSYSDSKTILLICLYLPIFITALVGNILVLLVVLPNRSMRNVTNCFIVNLAVADLLVTLICMPMAIGQSGDKPWIFGEFMCKIKTYMQGVAVAASVLTLMVLSMDRFLAIRHPMTFRSFSTSRYATCILISLWTLSFSLMVPFVLVHRMQTSKFDQQVEPVHFCSEDWDQFQGRQIYVVFLFVFMFVIPSCFIITSYSLIGCKLWTEKEQIHRRDSQVGREQTEKVMTGRRRVARMLVVLAIVFACSWLPYHIHSLYLDFTDPYDVEVIEALPYTILLGHANSALNPILYCFMNKSFRRTAAKLLHLRCVHKNRKHHGEPMNIVVHYQVATPVRPCTAQNVLHKPIRSWSTSSAAGSRSTAGNLRFSANSTKSTTSMPLMRRSLERHKSNHEQDIRVFRVPFSHIAAAEKVLQHEVYPASQTTYPSHKRRLNYAEHMCPPDLSDILCSKREMFDFALSIPTTINEEPSRASSRISPTGEYRSILIEASPERSSRDKTKYLQRHSAEYYYDWKSEDRQDDFMNELHRCTHHRKLDDVDIQIHFPRTSNRNSYSQ